MSTPNPTIQEAAAITQTAANIASIASGNPEIAALADVAVTLASAVAQIIASAGSSKPVTEAEWHQMGTALGAALKAYQSAP